jgi:hypothetical protein
MTTENRSGQSCRAKNVGTDGVDGVSIVSDDLIVGSERVRGRDHDARSAEVHHISRQSAHCGEARGRHSHDDGQARALDDAAGDIERFPVIELRCFAKLAEDRYPVDSRLHEEIRHPIDGRLVDPPVVKERSGGNWDHPLEVGCQDQCISPLIASRATLAS